MLRAESEWFSAGSDVQIYVREELDRVQYNPVIDFVQLV